MKGDHITLWKLRLFYHKNVEGVPIKRIYGFVKKHWKCLISETGAVNTEDVYFLKLFEYWHEW